MKNLFTLLSGMLMVFVFTACPSTPHHDVQFGLNETFSLKQGKTAQSKETPEFTITFDKVTNDSRCPIDAICIVPGQADMLLTFKKGASTEQLPLTYTLGGNPANNNSITFEEYTIKVTGLQPPKKASEQIKPEDYVVQLVVTK